MADVARLDHLAAGLLRFFDMDPRLALRLDPLGIGLAHGFQRTHPPFVTGTARLDALPYPGFFLRQFFIEQAVAPGFRLQPVFLFQQKFLIAVRPVGEAPAIQFQDAGRQPLQEGPVVGHKHDAARKSVNPVLQPLYGAEVQMVGGFVQK